MFLENFKAAILANIPAISIVTHEWERITDDIYYVATNSGIEVAKWNPVDGLITSNEQVIADAVNLLACLERTKDFTDTCIVFTNFNSAFKNPAVIQKLRECFWTAKGKGNMYVFVSVSGEISPELEKEIVILDYQLPDKEEIKNLLHKFGEIQIETELKRDEFVDAAIGLTRNEAENLLALSLAKNNLVVDAQTIEEVKRQKAMALKKTGVLELYEPENLPKVGGLDVLKLWLWERQKAFSPEAREFGLPFPKGILVFGIPGTGKSLIAKTIARQWNMQLLMMGNILDKYVGESEKRMKEALKQAEAMAPCVLMIDEIEKFFAGAGGTGDSGVSTRVFGQFLSWMQETTAPVFVVATANNIGQLPPELMRKGRFDEIFFVDLPSCQEREEIFSIHLGRKSRHPENFDLNQLTDETSGYTGSEIEQIVIAGLFRAFAGKKDISTSILLDVAKETPPLSVTMAETIEIMRKWGRERARPASSVIEEPEKKPSAFTNERKIRINR